MDETPNVTDLTNFYKQAREKFEKDPDFKKKAQQKVVDLQKGD